MFGCHSFSEACQRAAVPLGYDTPILPLPGPPSATLAWVGAPSAHLPSGWPLSSAALVLLRSLLPPFKGAHGLQPSARRLWASGTWPACLCRLIPACSARPHTHAVPHVHAGCPSVQDAFLLLLHTSLEWLSPTHIMLLKSGSASSKDPSPHPHQSSLGPGSPVTPRTHLYLNSAEHLPAPPTRFPGSESLSVPSV